MPLTGHTRLIGLLADPVDHIRAPEFLDPLFAERKLDVRVVPLHVRPDDLAAALSGLRQIRNLVGAILTMPHKQAAARLCTRVSRRGTLAGAVNVVRFDPEDALSGDMVDGIGLLRAMAQQKVEVRERRVLLLGAGGAARAIATAFAEAGVASITLANREAEDAAALAAALRRGTAGAAIEITAWPADPAGFDLLVNATALGLHAGDPPPLDVGLLRSDMDVVEINAPIEWTALRDAARKIGCRTVGGRAMADQQVESFVDFFDLASARA